MFRESRDESRFWFRFINFWKLCWKGCFSLLFTNYSSRLLYFHTGNIGWMESGEKLLQTSRNILRSPPPKLFHRLLGAGILYELSWKVDFSRIPTTTVPPVIGGCATSQTMVLQLLNPHRDFSNGFSDVSCRTRHDSKFSCCPTL